MKLFRKIRFWFWWKFKATDEEKVEWQFNVYGVGISKNGKFLDIKDFYKLK